MHIRTHLQLKNDRTQLSAETGAQVLSFLARLQATGAKAATQPAGMTVISVVAQAKRLLGFPAAAVLMLA